MTEGVRPREIRQMHMNSGHVIVVLGMHRSGTSAITKALQVLGVSLGENLMSPAADNPTGFWEDNDVCRINEALLRHIEAAYDHLGLVGSLSWPHPVLAELRAEAAALLKARLASCGGLWGFKDPRTCRLMDFWRPVLEASGCRVGVVLPLRNPLSVVRSLERRERMPAERGYMLWLEHVVCSILSTGDVKNRVIVDYDRMMEDPSRQLHRMADRLGMAVDPVACREFSNSFLDGTLRHSRGSLRDLARDSRAPHAVSELFHILSDCADDRADLESRDLYLACLDVARSIETWRPLLTYYNRLEDSLAEPVEARNRWSVTEIRALLRPGTLARSVLGALPEWRR